jgi:hypothetical protein
LNLLPRNRNHACRSPFELNHAAHKQPMQSLQRTLCLVNCAIAN